MLFKLLRSAAKLSVLYSTADSPSLLDKQANI